MFRWILKWKPFSKNKCPYCNNEIDKNKEHRCNIEGIVKKLIDDKVLQT